MQRVLCRLLSVAASSQIKKSTFAVVGRTRRFFHLNKPVMSYTFEERGTPNTDTYRVFIKGPNGVVSPFHDIPLYANAEKNVINMVVEIPRWTNHKMEINKDELMNPIKQDIKKGKVRFVKNCFPHHGYIWNYGAIPQTWEDPNHKDETTQTMGDNDPLDILEIGQKVHQRGSVIQVKVLGTMCLIDEGETDWKIIAVDVNDPLANELNDVSDVEKNMPGYLEATSEWFKIYKVPDGKPLNTMEFDGKAKNKEFANKVIEECNQLWEKLMNQTTEKPESLRCENVTVPGPYKITQAEADNELESNPLQNPAALPDDVDKNHFVAKPNL